MRKALMWGIAVLPSQNVSQCAKTRLFDGLRKRQGNMHIFKKPPFLPPKTKILPRGNPQKPRFYPFLQVLPQSCENPKTVIFGTLGGWRGI